MGSLAEPSRILVVDDDDAKRYVLTRTLRNAKDVVSEAVNGKDALAQVPATLPERVVLDVMLPVNSALAGR